MNSEIDNRLTALDICPVGGQFAPLSDEEIATVEAAFGERLPDDYRDFARRYGRASFGQLIEFRLAIPEALLATVTVPRYERAPLSHFYGASTAPSAVAEVLRSYKGRMPATLMPIADDGAGNQICLGISGPERGKVYYWDHDNEWDEDDYEVEHGMAMPPEAKLQNVYLVAESFEDFIGRLQPTPARRTETSN